MKKDLEMKRRYRRTKNLIYEKMVHDIIKRVYACDGHVFGEVVRKLFFENGVDSGVFALR